MGRPKLNSTTIRNQVARNVDYKKRLQGLIKKINELTILCDLTACLIFFSRDDNKIKVWPSPGTATALIERFYSMSDLKRTMKSDDQESFIKTKTVKIEKKLADSRRVCDEIEMDLLMAELNNGNKLLEDLTQSQIEKLKVYSDKKIKGLRRELGSKGHHYTTPDLVGEQNLTRGLAFAPDWGMMNGFNPMESRGSGYVNNFKWSAFDEPKVEKPLDEDKESSDDDSDDMAVVWSSSSSSDGEDDE